MMPIACFGCVYKCEELLFGPKLTLTCRVGVNYHNTEMVWAIAVLCGI